MAQGQGRASPEEAGEPAQDAARPYVHEHWTVADGLPLNTVNHIVQTRDGYLWMATYDGLVRFDGVRFTVFNTANTPSLSSPRVVALYPAPDGTLWIDIDNGASVHLNNGVFTSSAPVTGAGDNEVLLDNTGQIFVLTPESLFRYQEGALTPDPAYRPNTYVKALITDQSGARWMGTDGHGLIRYHEGHYTTFTMEDGLSSNYVQWIQEDNQRPGRIWFIAYRTLYYYEEGVVTRVPTKGRLVRAFQEPSGRWWLTGGLTLYRSENSNPASYVSIGPGETGIWKPFVGIGGAVWVFGVQHLYRDGTPIFAVEGDRRINHVIQDREGNVWVATIRDGLHRLRPGSVRVYGEPEGLPSNVYPIVEDRAGTLWIGSLGLHKREPGSIGFTSISSLSTYHVYALHEDRAGTLWVGTTTGLFRMREDTIERAPALPDNFNVRAIFEDRAGTLWVGFTHGLYRLRPDETVRFDIDNGLPNSWVQAIYETRDGTLWMATKGGGVVRYKNEQFTVLSTEHGLTSNIIRALYEDADGVLWIGSEDLGLNRVVLPSDAMDFSDAQVTTFQVPDGLYDNGIHRILEDNQGRLWMNTNRGIFWVKREELNAFAAGARSRIHSVSYTEQDGLRNREGNGGMQPAGIKARDGRLWFPTQEGAVVVDPNEIAGAEPPPVVIEDLIVNQSAVPVAGDGVMLAAHERDFDVTYTALSYLKPDAMRFQYRLDGYNLDWEETGARRTAFFSKVSPGTYTFRVRAMNSAGVWNETATPLRVTIAPYFYETRWFYALCGVLALALLAGGFRWRVQHLKQNERALEVLVAKRTAEVETQKKQLEEQAEVLRSLDQAKSRFFANISHEFRTPLALTIGPLEDLLAGKRGPLDTNVQTDLALALRNSRRQLRLINQLLDVAKLEAGEMKLQASPNDLKAFLGTLTLAFTPFSERKRITFNVDLSGDPLLLYFDPDQLEKVFTNLLSNAFKFTPTGGVIYCGVQLRGAEGDEQPGQVEVVVRDNGPGIPPNQIPHIFERFYQTDESTQNRQAGTGIGLALVKELVDLHGGEIAVESQPGFGTTFTVRLFLGRDHLQETDLVAGAAPRTAKAVEIGAPFEEAGLETSAGVASEADDVTTVLVVDDNADIRRYVRRHLEARYRVVEASDGQEGLDQVRTVLPDLVLSDVMMPKMDGHELCQAIKQDTDLAFIPVILLTAKAETEDKIEGLREGADDYITKPFNADELVARVDNLIASRRRLWARIEETRPAAALLHADAVDVISADDVFLEQVRTTVEAHINDSTFNVEQLAAAVGVGRTSLYRRLGALVNASPNAVILQIRMERAAQLLVGQAGLVSEVAYAVGFKSVAHFSKRFRDQYGVPPSRYVEAEAG